MKAAVKLIVVRGSKAVITAQVAVLALVIAVQVIAVQVIVVSVLVLVLVIPVIQVQTLVIPVIAALVTPVTIAQAHIPVNPLHPQLIRDTKRSDSSDADDESCRTPVLSLLPFIRLLSSAVTRPLKLPTLPTGFLFPNQLPAEIDAR